MIRRAVIGASGYSRAELVTLLAGHPEVCLVSVHADQAAGRRWGDLYPGRRHLCEGLLRSTEFDVLERLDAVLVALPSGVSGAAGA